MPHHFSGALPKLTLFPCLTTQLLHVIYTGFKLTLPEFSENTISYHASEHAPQAMLLTRNTSHICTGVNNTCSLRPMK